MTPESNPNDYNSQREDLRARLLNERRESEEAKLELEAMMDGKTIEELKSLLEELKSQDKNEEYHDRIHRQQFILESYIARREQEN